MARRRHDAGTAISLFSFQDIMAAVTGIMIMVTLLLALEPLADEMLHSTPRRRTAAAAPEPMPSAEAARELVAGLRAALERRLAAPAITEATVASLQAEDAELRRLESTLRERRDRALAAKERSAAESASAQRERETAQAALERTEQEWTLAQQRSRVRFLPGERFPKAPLFVEVAASGCTVGEFGADAVVHPIGRSDDCTVEALAPILGDRSPASHQVVLVVRADAIPAFATLCGALSERGWEVGWQLWDAREGGFFEPPPPDAMDRTSRGAGGSR